MDILAFGKNIQSSLQYNFIKGAVFLEVMGEKCNYLQTANLKLHELFLKSEILRVRW